VVDGASVDDQRVQWLDGVVRDSLAPTALAAALVTVLLAITQPLLVPPEARLAIVASSLATALALGSLWLVLQRFEPPAYLAHPIAATMALLGYLNTGVFFAELSDPRHTTTLMLIVFASGCVVLSRRWLAAHLAGALLVFAAAAWSAPTDPAWAHFGVAIAFAMVIAALLHEVRLRTLQRLRASLDELTHELSERGQAEDALRAGEARFRQIFEHAPVMMQTIDREARIVAVNDKWLEETGYARDGVVGRPVTAVLTPESAEAMVRETLPRFWREGAIRDVAMRLACRDGSSFDVLLDAVVLAMPDGAATNLSVLRNVTARKRAEAERERFRHQLFEARKLESLGLLAGGIAHDFNNLLGAILGNAHLVLETLEAEHPERPSINEIKAAAERGALLTRQLLSYAGRAPADRVPVDLSEQTREVAELLRRVLPPDVVLRFELADSLPAVEVDPGQLQQVVMNLLRNAADAVGAAGGQITVRTSLARLDRPELARLVTGAGLEPGVYVRLDITDDGCGIDVETRERLFDPFFTSKEGGHGLGLPVALGVVRAHGGGIALDSEPGEGTTFRVYLPASSRIPEPRCDPDSPVQRGSGRVLIADDEESVRRVARRILERQGYGVVEAGDGVTAVECVREAEEHFVAALLDVRMPGGGVETARAMRELDPELPILLQSGFDADDAAGRVGVDAPTAFLAKPYSPRALGEALGALLARSQRKNSRNS
jgi:PAS domain S-box-containing protein